MAWNWKAWLGMVVVVALVRGYMVSLDDEPATANTPPHFSEDRNPYQPAITQASSTQSMTQTPPRAAATSQALNCDAPTEEGGEVEEDPTLTTTRRDYTWEYGGYEWTWSADIYDEAYQYYHERTRPAHATQWADYAIYATDPYSQPLVDQLACLFKETVEAEGMTASDAVGMALAFVQSLPYALDSVSAGFDDYPRFPLETLYDNGGDCEDTAILFASIVKALGYGVIMLGFDADTDHQAHVMAAVKASNRPGQYYTYQNERYYMAETTGEGFGIGDVPTGYSGDRAYFIPLTAKAKLDSLTWTNDGYSNGAYHYTATIHNGGSLDASNLHVVMGYEASSTTMWSKVEYADGDVLAVDETITIEFSLKPPPRGEWTRTMLVAWADNAPTARVYSNQWYW